MKQTAVDGCLQNCAWTYRIPPLEYLVPANSKTRSSYAHKFQQYSISTDSFFSRTVAVWNRLPAAAAESPSVAFFKRELSDLTF